MWQRKFWFLFTCEFPAKPLLFWSSGPDHTFKWAASKEREKKTNNVNWLQIIKARAQLQLGPLVYQQFQLWSKSVSNILHSYSAYVTENSCQDVEAVKINRFVVQAARLRRERVGEPITVETTLMGKSPKFKNLQLVSFVVVKYNVSPSS